MILSKYSAEFDVYNLYVIKGDIVTYESRFLKSQSEGTIRKWSHSIDELGFASAKDYVKHLEKRGYKKVKGTVVHENWRQGKGFAI